MISDTIYNIELRKLPELNEGILNSQIKRAICRMGFNQERFGEEVFELEKKYKMSLIQTIYWE